MATREVQWMWTYYKRCVDCFKLFYPKYRSYDVACESDKDKKETLRYIKRSVFLLSWGRYLGIFSCKIPCNFQKIWISKVHFNFRQLKGLSDASMILLDFPKKDFLKIAGNFAGNFAGKIAYMLPPWKIRHLPKTLSYHVVSESKNNENCIGVIYKLCM